MLLVVFFYAFENVELFPFTTVYALNLIIAKWYDQRSSGNMPLAYRYILVQKQFYVVCAAAPLEQMLLDNFCCLAAILVVDTLCANTKEN